MVRIVHPHQVWAGLNEIMHVQYWYALSTQDLYFLWTEPGMEEAVHRSQLLLLSDRAILEPRSFASRAPRQPLNLCDLL